MYGVTGIYYTVDSAVTEDQHLMSYFVITKLFGMEGGHSTITYPPLDINFLFVLQILHGTRYVHMARIQKMRL